MNILLTGPRGSGKSTIGPLLADQLRHSFVDLDTVVLNMFDEPTVREVFTARGENAWRQAEIRALDQRIEHLNQVIALGGGITTIPLARQRIEAERRDQRAKVFYLRCSVDELRRRLSAHTGDRPSLTGTDPVEEIEMVLRQRESSAYLPVADVVIECDRRSPSECVAAIIEAMGV